MPNPLLIANATVFDATGAVASPATSILIEDGRISAVAPAAQLSPPEGVEVLDAAGK